jgi:hypothetical protein
MKIQKILDQNQKLKAVHAIPEVQIERETDGEPIKNEKISMRRIAKSQSGKIDAAKMVRDLF